jgi:phage/plasmid-like protein (TIGR03299 family)
MAHNLNVDGDKVAMMFVGQVPWHGLGTRLETSPATAAEAMKAANLDWEVGLKSVYCADGEHYYEIPDRKAIVRLDKWGKPDCAPFGLVGNDYQVYQNRDAFAFFDPLLATKKVTFETAGALGGGERVWVTAKVDGNVSIGNDRIERYLLLSTGHDGKTAVQIRFTPVRVVCQNTLMAATMSGRDFAKVYHVPGMQHSLFDAQTQLESILKSFVELESSFTRMIQKALQPQDLAAYFAAIFPEPQRRTGQSDSSYDKALAKIKSIRNSAAKYFREGKGNTEAPANGTLWAAYNGVVELLDHHSTYRDRWDRLESLWFGEAQRVKQRAYDEACKMLAA